MKSSRGIGLVLVTAGVLLLFFSIRSALVGTPEIEVAPPPPLQEAAVALEASTPIADIPIHITIPSIHVDAKIQKLGLLAGNRMAAPTNYRDVGWYKYGAVPSSPGTAVMYGHLDDGLGLNGVFFNLKKVAVGDPVTITDAAGATLHFVISDIETYPYKNIPPSVLGEDTTEVTPRISLITCAGRGLFDKVMGFTYDHRLVVTATYVSTS